MAKNTGRYYFVYTLSYGDAPFYVGFSYLPSFRYYSHIYDGLSRCHSFVRFCIYHLGEYPTMNIIDCTDCKLTVRGLERQHIEKAVQDGCDLLNFRTVNLEPVVFDGSVNIPKHIYDHIDKQTTQYINNYEQNRR